MADTDLTEPPTDEPAHDPAADCPQCGATGTVTTLGDGTLYCSAHRGIANAEKGKRPTVPTFDGTTAPVREVLEALGANAEPTAPAEDGGVWALDKRVQMVASLCLEAALSTFHDDGTFGDPPTGWAPPPADESPFMEAGVVLAVATLIEAAELPRDLIQTLADTFAGRETPNRETSDD